MKVWDTKKLRGFEDWNLEEKKSLGWILSHWMIQKNALIINIFSEKNSEFHLDHLFIANGFAKCVDSVSEWSWFTRQKIRDQWLVGFELPGTFPHPTNIMVDSGWKRMMFRRSISVPISLKAGPSNKNETGLNCVNRFKSVSPVSPKLVRVLTSRSKAWPPTHKHRIKPQPLEPALVSLNRPDSA